MPDQVPDEVKHERLERLVDVVQRIAAERNAERVGRVEEVLVEGPEPYRRRAAPRPHAPKHDGQLHRFGPAGRSSASLIDASTSTTLRGREVVARRRLAAQAATIHTFGTNCHTHATTLAIRSKRVVGWGAPRAMTRRRPEVIAVFGPTGSGKTSASEIVARASALRRMRNGRAAGSSSRTARWASPTRCCRAARRSSSPTTTPSS